MKPMLYVFHGDAVHEFPNYTEFDPKEEFVGAYVLDIEDPLDPWGRISRYGAHIGIDWSSYSKGRAEVPPEIRAKALLLT